MKAGLESNPNLVLFRGFESRSPLKRSTPNTHGAGVSMRAGVARVFRIPSSVEGERCGVCSCGWASVGRPDRVVVGLDCIVEWRSELSSGLIAPAIPPAPGSPTIPSTPFVTPAVNLTPHPCSAPPSTPWPCYPLCPLLSLLIWQGLSCPATPWLRCGVPPHSPIKNLGQPSRESCRKCPPLWSASRWLPRPGPLPSMAIFGAPKIAVIRYSGGQMAS